jgi:uncharacterized protein (TIGR00369 family)
MDMNKSEALQELGRVFVIIPFNRMLGLELTELNPDFITLAFAMKEELIGNFLQNTLHGGVISSVLDMAGGMAVMAHAVHKHPEASITDLAAIIGKCSTVDLKISYLRPGRGEFFKAAATILKSGKKIFFTRMDLVNQDNVLLASGSGTYLIK